MSEVIIGNAEILAQKIQDIVENGEEFEIVMREKDGKMKPFIKFLLENSKDNEDCNLDLIFDAVNSVKDFVIENRKLEAAKLGIDVDGIAQINKIDGKIDLLMKDLGSLNNLQKFNLLLDAADLCATTAGFAIMYAKLNDISNQILDVVDEVKKQQDIEDANKFSEVISEYNNMLDCIDRGNPYSEKEYRNLVDKEYNTLKSLIHAFMIDASSNQTDLLYSVMALSCMLSTTICYFDEVYYYASKEKKWHRSHGMWTKIYTEITSKKFQSKLQDLCFLDLGLNQYQTDLFVGSVVDSSNESLMMIKNHQLYLQITQEKEKSEKLRQLINQKIVSDVETVLSNYSGEDYEILSRVFHDAEEKFCFLS